MARGTVGPSHSCEILIVTRKCVGIIKLVFVAAVLSLLSACFMNSGIVVAQRL